MPACNITAVVSHDNQIFIWGQCRGQSVLEPQKTRLTAVDDVFACFASPPVSWRLILLGESDDNILFALNLTTDSALVANSSPTVQESVKNSFDDPVSSKYTTSNRAIFTNVVQALSDVKFVVEGKPIHVNKSILKIRYKYALAVWNVHANSIRTWKGSRCQHYRSMFEGRWSEVEKDFIEITQLS